MSSKYFVEVVAATVDGFLELRTVSAVKFIGVTGKEMSDYSRSGEILSTTTEIVGTD